MAMKLIVGLGNPGERYVKTRHNVGHMVVDALVKRGLPRDLVAKNTGVFMNSSGDAVKRLLEQYGVNTSELWVIHDDLDIPLGSYKIQKGKGPKVHYGINSIEETLGTDDFWRVRVGIDNREPDNRISGEQYVLQDFKDEEAKILGRVTDEICKKLVTS
jgi:PTH1 family peptidyl-tRNA hydrolase